jgi:hypothetical protein
MQQSDDAGDLLQVHFPDRRFEAGQIGLTLAARDALTHEQTMTASPATWRVREPSRFRTLVASQTKGRGISKMPISPDLTQVRSVPMGCGVTE